ncbi:SAM-dependent methyltransferase [Lentibacter algarum]|uniref:SAM-dependent methyltransferase n=1 Tax=Lentibacter algarum TaxID=576131 RepID=UPI002091C95F|nr:SAM-dependent methyltransferase [Lentibacter algarum]
MQKRKRASIGKADFVSLAALDEVQYRLDLVNRTFKKPLLAGWQGGLWAEQLASFDQTEDAETLDVSSKTHDLIVHGMSLHWSNDIVGQLIQCRNAMLPDGLFIGVMFGGESLQELRKVLAEAELQFYGGLSPRVAMMAEVRDAGQLLQRAGFALPVVDKIELKASYENIFHLIRDLRHMGETSALHLRKRSFERKGFFELANELYKQHFSQDDGRIIATFEVMFLTGWTPHESQQKPLRPGSAKARLAEALSTIEVPLKD